MGQPIWLNRAALPALEKPRMPCSCGPGEAPAAESDGGGRDDEGLVFAVASNGHLDHLPDVVPLRDLAFSPHDPRRGGVCRA